MTQSDVLHAINQMTQIKMWMKFREGKNEITTLSQCQESLTILAETLQQLLVEKERGM